MRSIYLEAGINHFGNLKEANIILNYFLKSNLKYLTFMIHTEKFYKLHEKKGIDFNLGKKFYETAIKKCHSKNKKLGLAVCRKKTFDELSDLKFDFYKLLSVGIDQKDLILDLKKKNKPIFISTGLKVRDINIDKCLKLLKKNRNLCLLHTPMTYNIRELNFSRINYLRKKFNLDVGYSNHNNEKQTLSILTSYKPDCLFIYCKPRRKKGRVYPDDQHAFYFDELSEILDKYVRYLSIHDKSKIVKKVKIFKNEFKF
jgi:sialic acid synthase SpsE